MVPTPEFTRLEFDTTKDETLLNFLDFELGWIFLTVAVTIAFVPLDLVNP